MAKLSDVKFSGNMYLDVRIQKNYIQINNLILTEEDIRTLPQESVIEIENFVKKFQSIKEQKRILPKIEIK